MLSFLTRFAAVVRGVLSGLDRLTFTGSLRCLAYSLGLQNYLWYNRVLFKDFAAHSQEVSARLEEASLQHARDYGREIRYLNSAQHRKEDIAREIAARDRIREGLICVLRSIDPCRSFDIRKNHNWPSRNQGFGRLGGRRSRSSSLFLSGRAKRDMRWIMAM